MLDLIIKNGKSFIDGELKKADVGVKDGKFMGLAKLQKKLKK